MTTDPQHDTYRQQILYAVQAYSTLILVSPLDSSTQSTLAGRSRLTRLAVSYLYETGWAGDRGGIASVFPRQMQCSSAAEEVAYGTGAAIGCDVCVKKWSGQDHEEGAKVQIMTTDTLIRETVRDPLLLRYAVVLLSDIHERTALSDVLLGLLKKIQKVRPLFKLVVCMGLPDARAMYTFFHIPERPAYVLRIDPGLHPVDHLYLDSPVSKYVSFTIETIKQIHRQEQDVCFMLCYSCNIGKCDRLPC